MRRMILTIALLLSMGSAAEAGKVRVASMTVNGLRVKNLRCELAGGSFMAAVQVVGALAKKVKALKACAKTPVHPLISWVFRGGKATRVTVKAKRKAVSRCVKKAVQRVRAKGLKGECSATLLLP